MTINPTSSATGAASVYTASPFTSNATMMNPEQVIALCAYTLNNLGSQLKDYSDQVKSRHNRENEIRALQGQLRDMAPTGGDFTGHYDADKYNDFMTRLAKLLPDENIQKTYDEFLDSYGGYVSKEDVGGTKKGEIVGTLAGDVSGDHQDCLMDAKEMETAGSQLSDALTSLNSDNDLTMMNLNQLMQQRNQASQLYSGMQSTMNESMKSIIGKIG